MKYPVEESDYKNRLDLGQKLLWGVIAQMLKGLKEHFGEEALEICYDSVRKWDRWEQLCRECDVTIGNGTVKDINPPYLHVDRLCFSMNAKAEVVEHSDKMVRFLLPEGYCNVAETINKIFPSTCSIISRAIEQGIVETVNPRLKVSGNKFLATGDKYCDITISMKNLPQTEIGYSERET